MCRMCGRNTDASVSRRFLVIRKKGREMQKTEDASVKSIVADCSSEGMTCMGIKHFTGLLFFLNVRR